MAIIQVPKPPKSAWDPNRPVSSLLKSQMEHLYEAEKKLPHKYKSQIYINAIKTEGAAAAYIQKVTEAIHRAHEDASAKRDKAPPKRRKAIAIAAVADKPATAKRATKTKAKKSKPAAKKKATSSAAIQRSTIGARPSATTAPRPPATASAGAACTKY